MRFQVPQFTDVEDKIIGSFTFKQFIYLAGGGGACIALYFLLPFFVAILFMIPIAALAGALAFLKINSQPFVQVLESYFKYLMAGRLYIWRHEPKKIESVPENGENDAKITLPTMTESKLKEINWNLDVKKDADTPL